jgi:hypothetical protein
MEQKGRNKMDLKESICGFIKEPRSVSGHAGVDINKNSDFENSNEESQNKCEQPSPRDGMSEESAQFLIGKCTKNTSYKVYGLENKGRYFTAKVLDRKGKIINELLVDKLNGNVKFIR